MANLPLKKAITYNLKTITSNLKPSNIKNPKPLNFSNNDKYKRLELAIYLVCWIIVFCIPLITQTYALLTGETTDFQWKVIMRHFDMMMPILVLFVLNNSVLLPLLFWKRHKVLYFIAVTGALIALWFVQGPPRHRPQEPVGPPQIELTIDPRADAPRPSADVPLPSADAPLPSADVPRPKVPAHSPVIKEGERPHPHEFGLFRITMIIIALCVIFANFGIKIYIHSLRRDVLMLNIQNEKMFQELQSLKYQVNPHFLMNTLNNIQSLIETSPVTAYKTIQQLSKMMRYVLYDNNSQSVPLHKEVEFMRSFIELMKIRYPDNVKISFDFPVEDVDVLVPPLLFISFLENAFKYGVSYTEESVIFVKLCVEDNNLIFYCANNIFKDMKKPRKDSGIGLKNVLRRLDLIYDDRYDLQISEVENTYIVEMRLPV